jgi:urea carboxylase
LDFFDQIQFYPVSEEELKQARVDFPLGRFDIEIEETELSLNAYQAFIEDNQSSISEFKTKQQNAFDAERQYWEESGLANFETETAQDEVQSEGMIEIPEGYEAVTSPITGSIWKIEAKPGDKIEEDQTIAILEAMKIEVPIGAEMGGTITEILVNEGDLIQTGQTLMIMQVEEEA